MGLQVAHGTRDTWVMFGDKNNAAEDGLNSEKSFS